MRKTVQRRAHHPGNILGGISLLWVFALTVCAFCCGPSLEQKGAAFHLEEVRSEDDLFHYLRFLSGNPKISKQEKLEVVDRIWELVRIFDAIPAYSLFLEKFPKNPSAEYARKRRDELVDRWPEPLREEGMIALAVEAEGPEKVFGAGVFKERISTFLKDHFGVDTAPASTGNLPSLKIKVWGEGLSGAYYSFGRSASLYSGARVQGKVLFQWPGRQAVEADFRGEIQPPSSFGYLSEKLDESNAPFDEAMYKKGSLTYTLMDILAENIDPDSLFYSYVRSQSPWSPEIDMSELLVRHKDERIARQMAEWIRVRKSHTFQEDSKELQGVLGKLIHEEDLEALAILKKKMRSENQTESYWPLVILGSRNDPEAVAGLLRLAAPPAPGASSEAAGQWRDPLGRLRDNLYLAIILRALGESGDKRGLEPIGRVLRTEHDFDLLEAALVAAAKLGGEEAVSLLVSFAERVKTGEIAIPDLGVICTEALAKAKSLRSSQ